MKTFINLKPLSAMPGPVAKAGKGNLDDIKRAGDLASFQLELHKQYGRLAKFALDDKVVAVSIADIHLLRKITKIFDRPESLYQFLKPLLRSVLTASREENKQRRNVIIKKFTPQLLEKFFPKLIPLIDAEIDGWLADSQQEQGVIKLQARSRVLAMRLAVRLVIGKDFLNSAKLSLAFNKSLNGLLALQYEKNGECLQELERSLTYINSTLLEMIKERRALAMVAEAEKVFLDELLMVSQDDEVICDMVKEVLMAGYHTLATTICWVLYAITSHFEVTEKVYREINALSDQPMQFADIPKFNYIINVVKETLRFYPSGPYTARIAERDLELGGFLIPKGTILFYPIWVIHLDPEYWEQPEKFIPERFTGNYNKGAYMPFGHGARICTGMNLANIEMIMVIVKILQRLLVQPVPGFTPIITEDFVLTSKNDIAIKIAARN